MKRRLATTVLALLLTAGIASAAEMQTVLTPDSTLYAIEARGEFWRLDLHLRNGETKTTVVVPGTDNDAIESDARLLWDAQNSMLFVVWHSVENTRDALMLASFDKDRNWSQPIEIAGGSGGKNLGLQTVLTYAADEEGNHATIIHAAWWSVTGFDVTAQYGMIAFENGQFASKDVESLNDLHEYRADGSDERENTGTPLYPPMAMARVENNFVDVVYGAPDTTKLTKVRIEPRLVQANARIWKPLGRHGERTGPARLVTGDSSPVQAFISNGRVVLYKPDANFRYVVLDNGTWSEEHMIQLDEKLSSEQMLRELRRTVDAMVTADSGPITQ